MSENNINSGKLVVISGPSGSGKGTVIKELLNLNDYKYSISATTRSPRPNEIDGFDYEFLTREQFEQKISNGDMLEYVEYSGNYYGTLKKSVEFMLKKNYNIILEIDVVGALKVKEKFPEAVMIFLLPPNFYELEQRLKNRATESDEIINERLERAKKEISDICKYDYLIINQNDMPKKAAFEINCIVEAEKNKTNQENIKSFLKEYFPNN